MENDEVLETNAQAYARAVHVWVTWLRHWRRTRDPRALHAARVCRQNVREILSVRRVELMRRQAAYRARRADLTLDQTMYQIRSDEMARDQRRMSAASARFSAPETKASYEVMELVRGNSALSLLVIRLREAGLSWQAVQTAIETKISRGERAHGCNPAARVLTLLLTAIGTVWANLEVVAEVVAVLG